LLSKKEKISKPKPISEARMPFCTYVQLAKRNLIIQKWLALKNKQRVKIFQVLQTGLVLD